MRVMVFNESAVEDIDAVSEPLLLDHRLSLLEQCSVPTFSSRVLLEFPTREIGRSNVRFGSSIRASGSQLVASGYSTGCSESSRESALP